MKTSRWILVGMLFVLPQARAQSPITVGEDRLVSAEDPLPLVEPHLSADPKDPKHLLVGVQQIDSDDGEQRSCVAWNSFDGGVNWSPEYFPVGGCADAWSVILPDGTAIVTMLGGMQEHPEDGLFLFRSADGGRTWPQKPLGFAARFDHPMVFARDNQVYIVVTEGVRIENRTRASVSVWLSQDGGKTFGPAGKVTPSNLIFDASTATIGSDGTLFIGFGDHNRWGRPERILRPRSWLLRSTDQGRTFSIPLYVSESCEGYGGWSSIAADASDHLFWVCATDKFNGVLVQRSDDRGESWSNPARLNHRQTADSHTPNIAINKDGIIGVSWYERHDGSCLDMYFTASLDGGKTFVPEVKLSSATSCPDTPKNKGAFPLFEAGGDYSGMTATSDGLFHVVWSDARTGVYQLRTTTITVNARR